MEMTRVNVNKKNLVGVTPIYVEGKENAKEIRVSLLNRGINPEKLPTQSNVKVLAKSVTKS